MALIGPWSKSNRAPIEGHEETAGGQVKQKSGRIEGGHLTRKLFASIPGHCFALVAVRGNHTC